MKDYEDEAFDNIEKAQQRKVAHGVTDGSLWRKRQTQKEWVGLTDEEVDGLWEMSQSWNLHKHFYVLVECLLKQKNT